MSITNGFCMPDTRLDPCRNANNCLVSCACLTMASPGRRACSTESSSSPFHFLRIDRSKSIPQAFTIPQVGLTVVVTVLVDHTQQSPRASTAGAAVGSGARTLRPTSLRMLFTGTMVPVTIGESGRLTIGHELVVVTVLSGSATAIDWGYVTPTHDVFQPVLHLLGWASGAGAADAKPTAANKERV